MIETGDLLGLQTSLKNHSKLANQCISWFLNQTNNSDPLHYVCDCVFNGYIDQPRAYVMAQVLIENGALIEGSDGKESPLIAATSLGVESVAKLLIDAGAMLESSALFGARPLHWAASMGLPMTVDCLVQKGADIEAKCDEFGATPLYWAVFSFGPEGPNKKADPLSSAKILLEAGAKIETSNKQGVTVLECALQAESEEMYQLLNSYV